VRGPFGCGSQHVSKLLRNHIGGGSGFLRAKAGGGFKGRGSNPSVHEKGPAQDLRRAV